MVIMQKISYHLVYYSLYKKKRKPSIMFDNSSLFKDEQFKLAGYIDWYAPYQ